MAVLLALVRAAAGWLVLRADALALLEPGAALRAQAGPPAATTVVVLGGLGLVLFVWPRACLAGAALLAAGLLLCDHWSRQAGVAPAVQLPGALAVLGVLAAREWLGRRLTRS